MFKFDFEVEDGTQNADAQMDDPAVSSQAPGTALNEDASEPALHPSREIPLADLLRTLPDELTYTVINFSPTIRLPRRDFHDARLAFLAASDNEADSSFNRIDEVFDERSDLRPGVYEGGMKTWEGAGDLVAFLAARPAEEDVWRSVLEIGCGTAIPTLYLLAHIFAQQTRAGREEIKICLQDYNVAVLELMALPNILLTWYLHSPAAAPYRFPTPPSRSSDSSEPFSLRLQSSLISAFLSTLSYLNLNLTFFSGSWDALSPGTFDLVLTSETIYRSSSVPALVRCIQRATLSAGVCYVAAKNVYFGVGGSVSEFEDVVRQQGMECRIVWEVRGGSGRCVLEVKA